MKANHIKSLCKVVYYENVLDIHGIEILPQPGNLLVENGIFWYSLIHGESVDATRKILRKKGSLVSTRMVSYSEISEDKKLSSNCKSVEEIVDAINSNDNGCKLTLDGYVSYTVEKGGKIRWNEYIAAVLGLTETTKNGGYGWKHRFYRKI